MQKTVYIVGMVVIVFVISMNRNTLIDYVSKAWLSDEDREVLKDPKAANKAAYDKMNREGWEHSQKQQPQWGQGWQK
jgi:hypothetical protein